MGRIQLQEGRFGLEKKTAMIKNMRIVNFSQPLSQQKYHSLIVLMTPQLGLYCQVTNNFPSQRGKQNANQRLFQFATQQPKTRVRLLSGKNVMILSIPNVQTCLWLNLIRSMTRGGNVLDKEALLLKMIIDKEQYMITESPIYDKKNLIIPSGWIHG